MIIKIEENRRAEKGLRSVFIGIVVNMFLAMVKIIGGVLGNSYALIADGVESTTDIISSVIVWSGLKIASKPPDAEHPFGHGKAEPLAAIAAGLALLGAAAGIAIQSLREIITPHHAPEPFTLAVLLLVVLVKEALFRYALHVGSDLDSLAVKADAWHHRSDAITSGATFIGISVALIGGDGYESADDFAALAACVVIALNGVGILRRGLTELMDITPSPEVEAQIRALAAGVEGVIDTEKCYVRKSGLDLFVEIHVEVNGNMSVYEGHEISREVKRTLFRAGLGILHTVVHIEPAAPEKVFSPLA